jgi:hypothetical protein
MTYKVTGEGADEGHRLVYGLSGNRPASGPRPTRWLDTRSLGSTPSHGGGGALPGSSGIGWQVGRGWPSPSISLSGAPAFLLYGEGGVGRGSIGKPWSDRGGFPAHWGLACAGHLVCLCLRIQQP